MSSDSTAEVQIEGTGPPAKNPDPEDLMEEAIGYYESALSENTRRAYDRGWEDFVEFCDTYGRQALPDSKGTVAVYLSERADQLSPSTLKQRLAAIEAVHDL